MKHASKMLLVNNLFFEFGAGLFGPIYSIFVEQVGGSVLDAGISWAIFLISLGIVEFFVSKFIDKFSQRKILIIGNTIYALVVLSYIFVTNVYQLFALQLIAGIVAAVDNPAWSSWYARLQKEGKRGHDFALMYMSNHIAGGVAILIGSALAYFFGFKILFIIGSIFILLSTLFIIKIGKNDKQ